MLSPINEYRGPEIEFWISPQGKSLYNNNDWGLLPFLALSDGAHASVEEISYFTLLCNEDDQNKTTNTFDPAVPASGWKQDETGNKSGSIEMRKKKGRSLFGIACMRQLRSDLLKNRGEDITRSTVQKAVVVVLDRAGELGGVRERLAAVTAAWFAQEDFTNIDILKEFQESLKRDVQSRLVEHEVPIGEDVSDDVEKLSPDSLQASRIAKSCMNLDGRFLSCSRHYYCRRRCERACLLQFALISLIPNLMQNLQDCADPSLDSYAQTITRAASLKTSERNSLLAYMGLPLQIFGESSFFSPYTPLQQLDLLKDAATHSFVVGSTNSLLLSQKDTYCDILINLDEETNKISIINPALRSALALSAADRRWIDNITQTVMDTWDPDNPSRPNNHGYTGSEDAIRLQFEEYILSLLSSIAYKTHYDIQPLFDASAFPNTDANRPDPSETTNDFNNDFVTMWKQTPNYVLFNRLTKDASIFDIIEPKHPTAGGLNIEDVQRRLAQGVAELHLDERVREGRETVGRVLGEGRERVGAGVTRFWKEVEDFRQRREGGRSQETSQRNSIDTTALKDNITNVDTTKGSSTNPQGSSATAAGAWTAALRERAGKVQIQKPNIDTAQVASAARENAAKAGQYLSSWGSWAKERSKEWSDGRKSSIEGQPTDKAG